MANSLSDLEDEVGAMLGGKPSARSPAVPTPEAKTGTSLEQLYTTIGRKYGVAPSLLRALVQVESSGNPKALGLPTKWGQAKGLTQLMPKTAESLGVDDPYDPEQSLDGAARLLKDLLSQYDGDTTKALLAYHGGPDPRNWGPKTLSYPKKVLGTLAKLGVVTPAQASDPTPVPVAAPDGAMTLEGLENDVGKMLAPPPPATPEPAPSTPLTSPVKSTWNGWKNFASGANLGFGPELSAFGNAAKETLLDLTNGMPVSDVPSRFGKYYPQALDFYRNDKNQWTQENPGTAIATDIGGSMIPLVTAGVATPQLVARGAAPAVNAVRSVAPRVAGGIEAFGRFLAGTAGEGGKGLLPWLARRGSQTAAGALQGGGAAFMTSHMNPDEPVSTQMERGAVLGGAINAATAPVVNKLSEVFRAKLAPELADLGRRAQGLGLDLRGGQLSPNKLVQGVDKMVGAEANNAQLGQFTRAVSRTFGENTRRITPDIMEKAANRIGAEMSTAAGTTGIVTGPKFINDLARVESAMRQELPATDTALARLTKRIDTILNEAVQGNITGKTYQELTNYSSPLGRMIHGTDSTLKHWGLQIRRVLDDALEASSPPSAIRRLKLARMQYKNLLTVEPLVEKALPSGVLDPRLLGPQVRSKFSQYGYGPGGDLETLSEAGKFISHPTPQGVVAEGSGNPLTKLLHSPAVRMGELVGLLGVGSHFPAETAAGIGAAGAGYATTKGLGAYMRSPAYLDRLITNTVHGAAPPYNPLIPLMVPQANYHRGAKK